MSFHREKWIKATRKLHTCWWCGQNIEAGLCIEGDGIFTGHAHPEFQAALDSKSWHDDWPDGIEEHAYARGRIDDDRKAPPQFSTEYRGYVFPDRPKPSQP